MLGLQIAGDFGLLSLSAWSREGGGCEDGDGGERGEFELHGEVFVRELFCRLELFKR